MPIASFSPRQTGTLMEGRFFNVHIRCKETVARAPFTKSSVRSLSGISLSTRVHLFRVGKEKRFSVYLCRPPIPLLFIGHKILGWRCLHLQITRVKQWREKINRFSSSWRVLSYEEFIYFSSVFYSFICFLLTDPYARGQNGVWKRLDWRSFPQNSYHHRSLPPAPLLHFPTRWWGGQGGALVF